LVIKDVLRDKLLTTGGLGNLPGRDILFGGKTKHQLLAMDLMLVGLSHS